MVYTVTAGEERGGALLETDPVKAELRCIAAVLGTRKGSVPRYRDFGLDWTMLSKPMPLAETIARPAIREAIETWCPNTRVRSISFQRDEKNGRLIPTVEVEIHAAT